MGDGSYYGTVRLWSDGKPEANPRCLQPSWIQQCPECKAYFMRGRILDYKWERVLPRWDYLGSGFAFFDTGTLNYVSLQAAFEQLKKNGFSKAEEVLFRFMLWYAYNDEAWRYGSDEEKQAFRAAHGESSKQNLLKLQEILKSNSGGQSKMIRAEIWRELGEFQKAESLLSGRFEDIDPIMEMLKRTAAKDASVFVLSENGICLIH